ncbi:methionine ABC transporter ATP-binding protein [Williamsia sp. Leaf354]|uniref:methionine ABC transporter ATP-binding protein n=1 Tax=Williamsia sp. Leaf354 TaxID=1736349 RepID=UPI0009EA066F|nr:methionine ABC transporter ATP-binding protein [Williamsia sp. Leaf354]
MAEAAVTDHPAISFRGATRRFDAPRRTGRSRPPVAAAVDGVDLDIAAGTITGVIGYSGAGKSTLVRLINGLERPDEGRVIVDGEDISTAGEHQLRRVRREIGMVFQQFNLFSSRTVARNVEFPLRIAGVARDERAARVTELLEFVGIADKATQYPRALSGGQKQRVGIARALATSPKILLADEATSALDPDTTSEILALLRRVNRELGTAIVVITHEMDVIREICDRVAVLDGGRLIEQGDVYDVFARPQSAITRRLVRGAVGDVPSDETLARLRTRHEGRFVTVAIRETEIDADTGANTIDVADHFARAGVKASIVYGGIVELSQRPFGAFTVALQGSDEQIDTAVAGLRAVTDVIEHEKVGV